MPKTPDAKIALRWENGEEWAMLEVDFSTGFYIISNSLVGPFAQK